MPLTPQQEAEKAVAAIPNWVADCTYALQARAALARGDWRDALDSAEAALERGSYERWN